MTNWINRTEPNEAMMDANLALIARQFAEKLERISQNVAAGTATPKEQAWMASYNETANKYKNRGF